jgi:hypothetical protein
MDQIRSDVKSHKRLFSVDSEASMRHETASVEVVVHPAKVDVDAVVSGGDTELINHLEDVAKSMGNLSMPQKTEVSPEIRSDSVATSRSLNETIPFGIW